MAVVYCSSVRFVSAVIVPSVRLHFGLGRRPNLMQLLKPNSITLAGSKLVRSFEPDSVMEFGFYAAKR